MENFKQNHLIGTGYKLS